MIARRPDRADLAVALLGGAALVTLFVLSRGLTFFADEWAVIADRTLSVDSFFRPFNEHWLGVTTFVYRGMLAVFGLQTYVPYLLLLWALHLLVAAEVYVLVRRRTDPVIAVAVTAVVLFLGSGFENLFWAIQIGFLGPVAMGLGAALLLDRRPGTVERPSTRNVVVATGLLTLGVMTSGFGLFMLAFVGLDLLIDPCRRRVVVATFIPAGIYLAWYLTLGRSGLGTHQDPFTIDALVRTPGFVIDGVGTAFGSAFGVGPVLGRVAALAMAAVLVFQWRRGHDVVRAASAFGAIVVQYALLGVVRAQLFDTAAEYSRYAYLSAIFALLGITDLLRPVWQAAATSARFARLRVAILAMLVTVSLIWNGLLLVQGRDLFLERADRTRADLVSAQLEMPPGVDPDRVKLLDRPVTRLREIIAQYGAPLRDAWTGVERPIRQDLLDQARYELINPLPNQVVQPGEG